MSLWYWMDRSCFFALVETHVIAFKHVLRVDAVDVRAVDLALHHDRFVELCFSFGFN